MLRALRRISPLLATGLVVQAASAEMPRTDRQIVEQALWLRGKGQLEQAQELLSRWVEQHPESELLAMARAELYLAADNPFWARKVLGEYQSAHPPACEARLFAARVEIEQANLEQAEALLSEGGCDTPEALRVRRLLLRAEIAELREESGEAKRLVDEAETLTERYEEDDARLTVLERAYDPYRQPRWSFAFDGGLGYVRTGMGQAPLEVATPRPTQDSVIGSFELQARAHWPNPSPVRPIAEFSLLAVEQLSENTHELGLEQPGLRVGVELGRALPRFELAYGYDFVSFDAGSEQSGFFSSAHRGDYRLHLGRKVFAFGKVGYRTFRDERLSRLETEHGLKKFFDLSDTLGLGLGTAVRVHRAEHTAFDQVGLSGFASLVVQAPKGYEIEHAVVLSEDRFPSSEGFYGPGTAARRELLLCAKWAVHSPEHLGVRLSLAYEYDDRDSSANAYDFVDHRTLLSVSYRTSSDEWRARRIPAEGRVPLRHEKETPVASEPEKRSVRDIVRQDEEQRKNSSCLK